MNDRIDESGILSVFESQESFFLYERRAGLQETTEEVLLLEVFYVAQYKDFQSMQVHHLLFMIHGHILEKDVKRLVDRLVIGFMVGEARGHY